MIKIDQNIPIPPVVAKGGRPKGLRPFKYPVDRLEVGESFFVKTTDKNVVAVVRVTATKFGKRHGRRFTTRQVPDGIRVWRVEDPHQTEAKA